MGLLSKILGSGAAQPIEAVGNVLDKLFTSDEEKLDKKALLLKLAQEPSIAQIELNKVEASHRSTFVAGWRPYIGWVCGTSLAVFFIPQYVVATMVWIKIIAANGFMEVVPYPSTAEGLMELVMALLGLGLLRTSEKVVGRAK